MILLVVVVLLWMAVLAPSAWRRFGERQSVGSIDHFHHQLQLLEHAGPKTVAPAYRLHTATPGGTVGSTVPSIDSSRPKLVLLRPTDDAAAADVDDGQGGHYERVGVLDSPSPSACPTTAQIRPPTAAVQARHRCTLLMRCLCGVAATTAVIGLIPGLHLAWVVTGLCGLAALGLVALMAYARELDEQQRRRLHRAAGSAPSSPTAAEVAMRGYPGAWDEIAEPQAAAR